MTPKSAPASVLKLRPLPPSSLRVPAALEPLSLRTRPGLGQRLQRLYMPIFSRVMGRRHALVIPNCEVDASLTKKKKSIECPNWLPPWPSSPEFGASWRNRSTAAWPCFAATCAEVLPKMSLKAMIESASASGQSLTQAGTELPSLMDLM